MNKQAIIFGVGGVFAAIILLFFLSRPGEMSQKTNVLSETDQKEDSQNEELRDTINQLEEAKETAKSMSQNNPPEMQIDTAKTYTAVLSTNEGEIIIQLNTSATPITVNNFVSLAREKFYDETIFHRVIDGFMIQGGDPEGTGAGGPGYKFDDEPFEGEYTRGTVAMANAGPNTNGSQFFIMHKDYPLSPIYIIFGKVASGMDVVDKIASAEVISSMGGERSKPVSPVKVESVEIIEE